MHRPKAIPVSSAVDKSAVALKAFFAITQKWGLSSDQECVLLGTPKPTFYRWKKTQHGVLSQDQLERISYILGIYKALHILLPSREAADRWIHQPNSAPLFNGRTALDKMLGGQVVDLADVRRYLDAERG
jgi:uncharacterized protein (DUF2384 family)